MRPRLDALKQAARELAVLFAALAVVPLTPALAAAYAGLPWPVMVLSGAWVPSWYAWLWMRLRTPAI